MNVRTNQRQLFRAATLGLLAFASSSSAIAAKAADPALVGTWRLVRFEDTDAQGKVSKAFGENPSGFVIYDPTGHVHVQISTNPPVPVFAAKADDQGTDAEVRRAFEGYVAYFGTYEVDRAKRLITHNVTASLRPSYVGTRQERPYRLKGDTLILSADYPAGGRYYREFKRVR